MLTILSKIDYNVFLDVYPFTLTPIRDNINSSAHTYILHQRGLSHHVFILYIQQIKFILKKEEGLSWSWSYG